MTRGRDRGCRRQLASVKHDKVRGEAKRAGVFG